MNKDEDGDTISTKLAPPPKAADMVARAPTAEQTSQPQLPQPPSQANESAVNKFKLPKGRSMRANYIDVMNPNGPKGSATPTGMPTPVTSPLVPVAASSPQLFVPAPGKFLMAFNIPKIPIVSDSYLNSMYEFL